MTALFAFLESRFVRVLLVLTIIVSAGCIHLVFKYSIQTPISEELARHNPVAVLFMSSLIGLVVHMMRSAFRSRAFFQGWSLAPIVPCLIAIAFTSPTSEVHLQLFAGVTLYGFAWLALFAFLHGNRAIAFPTGVLFVMAIVCILVLVPVGAIFPHLALSMSPVGVGQKVFVVLFASFSFQNG